MQQSKDKGASETLRIVNNANIPGVLAYDSTLEELEQQLLEISSHHREEQQHQTLFFALFIKRCFCKQQKEDDHKSCTYTAGNNDVTNAINREISFTFIEQNPEDATDPTHSNGDNHQTIYDTPRPARRVVDSQV
ncbi:hypothetical protein PV325_011952 [Microctonus aethiopoides]|nr:hypothetical protein PV325_011952 [Microctonus aethiopoides]